ncbi:Small G protein signaling modulator 3-like, partial [Exaiptasia diaphana]
MWMRISGALQKKINAEFTYKQVARASSDENSLTAKQIEKDLQRTIPNNACFYKQTSTGLLRLRRILRALAWLYPDIGYCQGMGMVCFMIIYRTRYSVDYISHIATVREWEWLVFLLEFRGLISGGYRYNVMTSPVILGTLVILNTPIVASLLLFVEEEDAFWLMCTVIEDLNPPSYFTSTLIGVQADQRVLRQLIVSYLPHTDEQLKEHDIELSLITLHWFLTAFASVVHMKILLRIWDIYFYEGSVTLFRITLGMLKLKEDLILTLDNSAQIFNALSDVPGDIDDPDLLLKSAQKASASLTEVILDAHRKKHLAFLMADLGVLVDKESGKHLTRHQVNRRQLSTHRSFFNLLFGKSHISLEKAKNIKQTEFVADLREAIIHIAKHFDAIDPKKGLEVDYSMESHARDHERFINVARNRRRRAKALLDFERHDDDELGFRKNDIVT